MTFIGKRGVVGRSCRSGLVALAVLALAAAGTTSAQARPTPAKQPAWNLTEVSDSSIFFVQNQGANPVSDTGLVVGQAPDGLAVYDIDTGRVQSLGRGPGASATGIDVNNHGEVLAQGPAGVFVWSTRTGRVRTMPASITGHAVALNDRGDVLLGEPAALWNFKKGTVRSVKRMSTVLALNNDRWVVGQGGSTGGAAVWTPRAGARNLRTSPSFGSGQVATAINDEGEIVGSLEPQVVASPADVSVLWKAPGSKPCRIGTGGTQATVRAINRHGEMVGLATRLEGSLTIDYAYWKGCGGPTTVLPSLGYFFGSSAEGPVGINRSAQIVGGYALLDTGGSYRNSLVWQRRR